MKKFAMLALVFGGCSFDFEARAEEHRQSRYGLTKDDLDNLAPTESDIRARITNDARENVYSARLDEGQDACDAILWDRGAPVCARDKTPMKVVPLRKDTTDRQFPVDETAYYCPEDTQYWYHYEGGPQMRNVWMGPFASRLAKGVKTQPQ
jgi:hypothetical protein